MNCFEASDCIYFIYCISLRLCYVIRILELSHPKYSQEFIVSKQHTFLLLEQLVTFSEGVKTVFLRKRQYDHKTQPTLAFPRIVISVMGQGWWCQLSHLSNSSFCIAQHRIGHKSQTSARIQVIDSLCLEYSTFQSLIQSTIIEYIFAVFNKCIVV